MTVIMRTSPSRALTVLEQVSLLDEIERFAQEVWEGPIFYQSGLMPRLEMYEEKDELVIKAELPGIKKEDIDISLEGDCLTIKGEKKQEEMSKEVTYYSCERCFGEYSRSVTVPFPVDTEHISSTFENGLLEIRLPKAPEAKAKHIEVKVK